MTRTVAIVGSGPSGCYAAQALRRAWPAAELTMYDRLRAPYGLIRYGVAPDHHGTKAVARQFDRLFDRGGVRFVGGVEIGTDIDLDALRRRYDVVVLATGLAGDRTVGVPGERLSGVYGSGRFTRHLNAHPGEAGFAPVLGERVVVVGAGNVALDIARLLAKTDAQLEADGVAAEARAALARHAVRRVTITSRSEAAAARFDGAMLREVLRVDGVRLRVDPTPPAEAAVPALAAVAEAEAAAHDDASARVVVELLFSRRPIEIVGEHAVSGVRFERPDGDVQLVEADSVITAIGFRQGDDQPLSLATLDEPPRDLTTGRIAAGLYATGWFRRGPTGTIAENRSDARLVVASIVADAAAEACADGQRAR